MPFAFPYSISPLGDTALVIMLENRMDIDLNKAIIALYHRLQQTLQDIIEDMVPGYCSLTVYYAPGKARIRKPEGISLFTYISSLVERNMPLVNNADETVTRLVRIPVCYEAEYAPDINTLAEAKSITPAKVTALHSAGTYIVYMIGFLPGFAYMGPVDERIALPRKTVPQPVQSGSVGIAGAQTGIYPFDSPGGWHIIGRTPVKMFDPAANPPVTLRAGDQIQFYPISRYEYQNY